APAGITAPLEPVTAFCTVAVNLSPTLLVLVQTVDVGESESVVPAAIEPTAPPPLPPVLGRVTVLPLGVVVGVLGRLVVGVLGRVVDGREVAGRLGVFVAGGFAGTSESCGCAALSRFASARSRLKEESLLRALVSCFPASLLQAPSTSAVPSASGAARRLIYLTIAPPFVTSLRLRGSRFTSLRKSTS